MAPKIKAPPIIARLFTRVTSSRIYQKIASQVDWVRVWVMLLGVGFFFLVGLVLGYLFQIPSFSSTLFDHSLLKASFPPEASSSATLAWSNYTHPTAGYSFRYPSSWLLEEEASSSAVTVNLYDPRLTQPNVLPRLSLAVVDSLPILPSFLPQVIFGEVVGQKITLSSSKEPLREGYLLPLSSSLQLLAKTAPVETGFDYSAVNKEILATLHSPQPSVEKKAPHSSTQALIALSAQQKDEYIQFRLHSSLNNLTKVRFFADDVLIYELNARSLGGSALSTTFEVQSEATKISREWLQEEKNLPLVTYVYRHHRDWSTETDSCLPTKAFLHIFTARGKYYDVRLSEDLVTKKVCFEGEGIQVEGNWYYLFKKPMAGIYKLSAKVYDTEGRESETQIPRFQVR